MPKLTVPILALMMTAAVPWAVQASDRQTLIDTMVTNATSSFRDERNSIEIDDCTMTTYRWKQQPGNDWVLWSSFRFDMAAADLRVAPDTDGSRPDPGGTDVEKPPSSRTTPKVPEWQVAAFIFHMQGQALARFEKSNLRDRPADAKPSDRGTGDTHFYVLTDQVNYILFGPGVAARTQPFAVAYRLYVKDHCHLLG